MEYLNLLSSVIALQKLSLLYSLPSYGYTNYADKDLLREDFRLLTVCVCTCVYEKFQRY